MALLQRVLLGAIILAAIAAAASESNSSCITTCGSLNITYPFGTSEGCYLNPSFLITCNNSRPFLSPSNLTVLNILMDSNELRVSIPIATDYNCNTTDADNYLEFTELNFPISHEKNKLTAVGCDTFAYLNATDAHKKYSTGCLSLCDSIDSVVNGSCEGIGCCKSIIPEQITSFTVNAGILNTHSVAGNFSTCSFGFIGEEKAFNFSSLDLIDLQKRHTIPVVLDFSVGNQTCLDARKNLTSYACKAKHSYCDDSKNGPGYACKCSKGYKGNPYFPIFGCQDIDECKNSSLCSNEQKCFNTEGSFKCRCPKGSEGDDCRIRSKDSPNKRMVIALMGISISLLSLLVGGSWINWGLKRRKLIKLEKKFYQQNGGLMLQQQLSNHSRTVETAKIFSAEELKRATNCYDESRVLGQGGNGTVYKGVLSCNKVVAIKKSKICDHSQIKQFVNEVFVLTQINHRNVVKLLGCCLQTEVPLLVYEFITNGTLFDHIHDKSRSSSLSWEMRLKIAAETAIALAYLHSETSIPIFHRDVKTTNILLDDNYTAKVADFGASRLISLDQTQVTTLVQGTFGYLDPEYMHTGQLTGKSDVYSFGVVLAELLTGKKVVFLDSTGRDRKLAMYLVSAVKEDRVLQILENHIVNEGNIEELKEVTDLSKRCLSVKGEDRPSMKEAAKELEALRIVEKHPMGKDNFDTEETECFLPTSTRSFSFDTNRTIAGFDSFPNHALKPLGDGR